MAKGIFSGAGESLSDLIVAAQNTAIGGTISLIAHVAVLMVTIYYTILGYKIMSGSGQGSLAEFMKSSMKFILIAAFAMSVNNYNEWVVGSFNDLQTGIASAWSGESGSPLTQLDSILEEMCKTGIKIIKIKTGVNIPLGFFYLVAGVGVMFAGLVFTLTGAVTIIVAKVMFALLLAVGPLFIMALMFPVIKSWFDQWFTQVMTQIFTIGFVCLIVAALGRIFNDWTAGIIANKDNFSINTMVIIKLQACSYLLAYILRQSAQLAASLGGGTANQALSFMGLARGAGGMMAGAVVGAKAAGKGVGMTARGAVKAAKGTKAAYNWVKDKVMKSRVEQATENLNRKQSKLF